MPRNWEHTIHLIVDNYATHNTPSARKWLARHPRFQMHFTPTGASWINQVERYFGLSTSQGIRRGNFRSVKELEKAIMDYNKANNAVPKAFNWVATPDQIFEKLTEALNKRAHATPGKYGVTLASLFCFFGCDDTPQHSKVIRRSWL